MNRQKQANPIILKTKTFKKQNGVILMKKLISLVLSLIMIIGLFTGISVNATEQEQGTDYVTSIDFDVEAAGNYKYFGAEGDQSQYPVFVNDGDHGSAYSIYFTRPASDGGHRGYLLRNSKSETNEPLKLEYGKSYRINLDYKMVKSFWHWKNISIWWVKDAKANASYSDVRFDYNDRCTVIETIPGDVTSTVWEEASAVITPPDSTYVYPVLVVSNYKTQNDLVHGEKIYFDNITVSEYEFKNSTSIDFTYERENNYKYYNTEDRAELDKSLTELDGNDVFGVYVIGNEINSQRTYAIREEGTNYPMPLKAGQDYKISLKYLNKISAVEFNISIAWVSNPSIAPRTGLPTTYENLSHIVGTDDSYVNLSDCPYIQDIATVKSNAKGEATDWQTVTATITPYSDEKMYPVLLVRPTSRYGNWTTNKIYFDDISLSLGAADIVTSIDFEEEKNGNYTYYSTNITGFNDVDGDAAYSIPVTCAFDTVGGSHRRYLIRDSKSAENAPLGLEYGKYYKISLDYKVDKIESRWHVISVFWIKSPDELNAATFAPANNYPSVFETFKNELTNGWKSAEGIITPPNAEYVYPVLVCYNYGMTNGNNSTVHFDNILITNYEFKDSTYIDFDYEAGGDYSYYYKEYRTDCAASFTNLCDDMKGNTNIHGNIFNVGLARSGEGDIRSYAIREQYSNYAMPLRYGQTYNIELDYKIYMANYSYNIAIAWVDNPAITKITGLPMKYYVPGTTVLKENMPGIANTYMPLYSNSYVEDIAINTVKSSNAGWVTASATITPPDVKRIYPVLVVYPKDRNGTDYSYGSFRMSFDNIKLTRQTVKTVAPARVDYTSGRQNEFYSATSTINATPFFMQGAAVSEGVATFSAVNGMSTAVADMGALAISATDGNNFAKYKAGTKLNIAAKVDTNGQKLSVGIAYVDIIVKDGVYTEGDLAALETAGKLLKVADIEAGASGYKDVYGMITVPEHLNYEDMYLVVYSEDADTGAVMVKDITIGNADIDLNGDIDLIDLIRLKKATTAAYNCNCDINADDAITATDLIYLKKLLLTF